MNSEMKKTQLESFDNEVKELHPFLKDLLPKLQNVKHVEYTHGNNEYGSDFILITEDSTLIKENYIGVVVKSKKIQQNDVETIQRQIKESFKIPKKIFNGERSVSLNSVWFVTNKTISNNAKEKISCYFENKNISFIDIEHLIKLTDSFYSDYWHDMTSSVSKHIADIRSKVQEEDKRYTLLPNLDPQFYIEPDIFEIRRDEYRYKTNKKKKRDSVDINKIVEEEKFIMVEAQMGFGKSKLIRQLIKYYTELDIYEKKKILVFPLKYSELFSDNVFNVYSGESGQ